MSSVVQEIPPEVLEALAIPAFEGLADAKARGAICIWGGGPLTGETAVDLGEHMTPRGGSGFPTRCFPRACRPCVADHAHRGLSAHAGVCEQCADEAAECPVGRGLYRLVRQCRR